MGPSPKGGAPRGGGPWGGAPKGGAPKGGGAKKGGPLRVGAKVSRFFFPLPPQFSFSLLGVFSWNFGGFFEAPG